MNYICDPNWSNILYSNSNNINRKNQAEAKQTNKNKIFVGKNKEKRLKYYERKLSVLDAISSTIYM